MTINIAIAVAEGLVLAADSMTQIGVPAPLITYDSAEKLTEIADLPMAAMANGLGAIANRSILSLIREFEFELVQTKDYNKLSVHDVCSRLAEFVDQRYGAHQWGKPPTVPPGAKLQWPPQLGIIVGGYSPGEFFPEVYEVVFPGKHVTKKHPPAGAPPGGASITWWGWGRPLNRLLFGYDGETVNEAIALLGDPIQRANAAAAGMTLPSAPSHNPIATLDSLRPLIQMKFMLDGMPLQDAVAFADYLGNVVIGFSRFTVGMPAVGGELDLLAIQPEGLSWVRRKGFAENMARERKRTR